MQLALDDRGEGDPLVLIHGLGTSRRVWDAVTPALAERRRVVALDLPGFGESPPLGPGFELGEVGEGIAAELARVIDGRFDLVGHSLGGAVALATARARRAPIRRLVLHAPAGFRPRARPVAEAVAVAAPVLLAARRAVARPLLESAAARRALLWGALDDGGRVSPERAWTMIDASRGARRLRPAARTALAADLAGDLAEIELPVGLIWGDRDPLITAEAAAAIRRCRPEAPVEVVPSAGHVAQLEQPRAYAEALERLLARL